MLVNIFLIYSIMLHVFMLGTGSVVLLYFLLISGNQMLVSMYWCILFYLIINCVQWVVSYFVTNYSPKIRELILYSNIDVSFITSGKIHFQSSKLIFLISLLVMFASRWLIVTIFNNYILKSWAVCSFFP